MSVVGIEYSNLSHLFVNFSMNRPIAQHWQIGQFQFVCENTFTNFNIFPLFDPILLGVLKPFRSQINNCYAMLKQQLPLSKLATCRVPIPPAADQNSAQTRET